jgi:pyruvate, water dikinase
MVLLFTITAIVSACNSNGGANGDASTDNNKSWTCVLQNGAVPDFALQIGCDADFETLGARPLDAGIPGARSVKTIIDRADSNKLYFQNTNRFQRHFDFASGHLGGGQLPPIGDIGTFNATEYYSPDRRFLLGAVTWYDSPGVWTYEIAPYDTATAELVAQAYARIRDAGFFGDSLYFHPTSEAVESILPSLPADVQVMTTDTLFAGIDYQPLNLGEALGQLRFFSAFELDSNYVSPCDVVVLDAVPNDISVTAGIVTGALQTPLSHVNVLSQNRGTPNMGLHEAFNDPDLRALENSYVRLVVGPFEYQVETVTKEEADAWCEARKPAPINVMPPDLSVTELRDMERVSVQDVSAFGGKASNYGELTRIGDAVPMAKAFGIPMYYYKQFERENGFDTRILALLENADFQQNPDYRKAELAALQQDILSAPVNPDFEAGLMDKLSTEYSGERMRFRSSTNAEDLNGFTGAGLYDSFTGDPNDAKKPVMDAVRSVWASLWNFRAFEERNYRGIDHFNVGMAVLVHHSYSDEEANGVALTGNMFDESQPAFYINVQAGEASVVKPDFGTSVDSFLYYYYYPGQPMTFFSHSSFVAEGQTVLTPTQTGALGKALDAIHDHFAPLYEVAGRFYAMDVEFKFDDLGTSQTPSLWIKQARPHYGWAEGTE